jgi:hypothetical protein
MLLTKCAVLPLYCITKYQDLQELERAQNDRRRTHMHRCAFDLPLVRCLQELA